MRVCATNCFLCVSRGIVNGKMEDPLKLLSSSFRGLVVEYLNKKNSRVPVKIIDEMYSRFPDFVVPETIIDIIAGAESAPTSFLCTDAFRLLGVILKKNHSLSKDSQQLILDHVDAIISSFINALQSKEDMKAKRLKAIMHFGKDFAQYLKSSVVLGNRVDKFFIEFIMSVFLFEGL
jgi:hypothetical protein